VRRERSVATAAAISSLECASQARIRSCRLTSGNTSSAPHTTQASTTTLGASVPAANGVATAVSSSGGGRRTIGSSSPQRGHASAARPIASVAASMRIRFGG
jgi:hypothetical protein